MKCQTCGVQLEPGMAFCPNCGARVVATGETISIPTPQQDVDQVDETSVDRPSSGPRIYDAPDSVVPPRTTTTADPYAQYSQPTSAPVQPVSSYSTPSYVPSAPSTSTAATVSLIFGILSYVALPIIGAIVAVVAGHMAKNEIRRSNGQLGGNGLATAGLVLGYLHFALFVLAICAFIGFAVVAALAGQNQ